MKKMYTKDDIVLKAKELAQMIAETEEVDFFKRADLQVNQHPRIQQLINDIKLMQKEAVNLQHYGKTEALKQAEEKINTLQDELDKIPLVKEFKQSQLDVNGFLQLVSSTISNTVTDGIIKSTGEDLLKRTTTKKNGDSRCNE